MRSAGNFHPEWGYLAPAPGFLRTLRVVLVATAVGATAGAVVVVSLVERPGSNDDNASIAAHALVTSAPIVTAPVVAAVPAKPISTAASSGTAQTPIASVAPSVAPIHISALPSPAPRDAVSDGGKVKAAAATLPAANVPLPAAPPAQAAQPRVAAVAASPSAADADSVPIRQEQAAVADFNPVKKLASKRRRAEAYPRRWQSAAAAKKRWAHDGGFGPLLRLFSFRTGSSSYPN